MEHALEVSQLKRKIARLQSKIERQSPARVQRETKDRNLEDGRENHGKNHVGADGNNNERSEEEEQSKEAQVNTKGLSKGAMLLAERKRAKERKRKAKEIEKAHGEELEAILQEREDALRREFEGQKRELLGMFRFAVATHLVADIFLLRPLPSLSAPKAQWRMP